MTPSNGRVWAYPILVPIITSAEAWALLPAYLGDPNMSVNHNHSQNLIHRDPDARKIIVIAY